TLLAKKDTEISGLTNIERLAIPALEAEVAAGVDPEDRRFGAVGCEFHVVARLLGVSASHHGLAPLPADMEPHIRVCLALPHVELHVELGVLVFRYRIGEIADVKLPVL